MEMDCKMNKQTPCQGLRLVPSWHMQRHCTSPGTAQLVQALHDTETPEVPTSHPVVTMQGHATSLEHV